ncbi:hypothetical protein CG716_09960 [Mycolicibacterium sphagni]|uniref:Uncharacterized protein n=1 Tax=Mycolicibacterium sphagni TaxID=1786 RepID=A0A255DLW5_9MYCO|nr:hypothetical protein CG716_09960 [Mycolicibacterium sphagni]
MELPALTEKPESICEACRKHVQAVVDDSPAVWDSLHGALGDRSMRAGQERVAGTKNPPIPIDVEVDAVKDALADWLVAAAARVAELLNVDDPQPKSRIDREQRRIVGACTKLVSPHVDALLAAPAESVTVWRKTGESRTFVDKTGIDICLEIVRCHRVAHAILGDQHIHQSVQLPCPNCHARRCSRTVTTRKNGDVDDLIACAECKSSWTYEIYQFRCRRDAEDMEDAKLEAQERQSFTELIEQERTARELAEYLLAELRWKFSLALDCPNISAAEFATAVIDVKAAS